MDSATATGDPLLFAPEVLAALEEALAADPRGVPFLIVRGRMGGSAMTAAAVNALARAGL